MKKIISLLLTLVLIVSLVPMAAMAATSEPNSKTSAASTTLKAQTVASKSKDSRPKGHGKKHKKKPDSAIHAPGKHTLGVQYNTKYHWLGCACGQYSVSVEPHVNPKETEDDTCTCGYVFSDNADLVTLWIDGAFPIKNFSKNTTEYEIKAHSYKEVKEIKVVTQTFDSEATVELPEDLTLKEGKNTIEVKVIAENQKNTKTYTVTIIKE